MAYRYGLRDPGERRHSEGLTRKTRGRVWGSLKSPDDRWKDFTKISGHVLDKGEK